MKADTWAATILIDEHDAGGFQRAQRSSTTLEKEENSICVVDAAVFSALRLPSFVSLRQDCRRDISAPHCLAMIRPDGPTDEARLARERGRSGQNAPASFPPPRRDTLGVVERVGLGPGAAASRMR
jgi:hypothetical protein